MSEAAASKVLDLKRREAVPTLIAALRNPDRETGVFALGALKHLTGQRSQQFHASKVDSPERWEAVTKQWEKWWAGARAGWPASPDAQNVAAIHPSRSFTAPDFRATDSAGQSYSVSSLRGKVALLNFWMVNCGPCVAEMPGLNAVAARYRDRGLVVLGLETNGADFEYPPGLRRESWNRLSARSCFRGDARSIRPHSRRACQLPHRSAGTNSLRMGGGPRGARVRRDGQARAGGIGCSGRPWPPPMGLRSPLLSTPSLPRHPRRRTSP